MKFVVVCLAAALLGLSGQARADSTLTERADAPGLPATVRFASGGSELVAVNFAAEGCVLAETTIRRWRLPMVGPSSALRALVRGVTLDGISLGDLYCAAGSDTVLGGDVLSGLVVRVDTGGGRISVHGGAQRGRELVGPRAHLIEAERLADGRLAIPVRLNGAVGLGLIDPSAPRSVLNGVFRSRAGQRAEADQDVLDLAGFRVLVAPSVEPMEGNGAEKRPLIRLGRDALRGFSLVLDYPFGRVWVDPRS